MTVQCMLSSQRRSVLSRFLESTTFHGIPLLWNSQTRFEKVTYLLAFLISTAFTLYSITPVVTEYIEKPIGTSYVIESVFKLPLPAVSICPFGRFYRPYLKAKNISSDLLDYIEMAFMVGNVDSGLLNYSKLIEEQLRNPEKWESELNAALSRLSLTFDQFIEEASLSCRDLMTNCKNYTDYSMDCCDGSKRIITSGGPCFTLNMSPQVDGNGLGYGQTISVRLNATNISESNNVALNEGILVKLSEPGLGIDFPTIFAPAGAHTLLQLKAVISQTQLDFINDPPRFRCLEEVPPDYSPLLCYQQCLLEPLESACNCRYVGVHRKMIGPQRPVCRPAEILLCGYKALSQKMQNDSNFTVGCRSRCQGRCRYWQYHPTVSYANFPTENDMWLGDSRFEGFNEANVSRWRESEIILEIFFEKLEFTKIKHFPTMTLYNFVANLGGQAGLWMGGSILSIVHLLVFLIIIACTCDKAPKLPEISESQQPFIKDDSSLEKIRGKRASKSSYDHNFNQS